MVLGGTPRPLDFNSVHAASGGVENSINHYFGYQIRILRGRFTPVGFLLEKVLRFFDFFVLFVFLSDSCAKLGLNLL